MNKIKVDFQAIHNEALALAKKAESDYVAQYGEPFYCGFAWVDIDNGRSPFVNWCKKNGVGSKHWRKGWCIWNPAGNGTQSMDVKEAGAYAYAAVLRNYNIDAQAGSRAD